MFMVLGVFFINHIAKKKELPSSTHRTIDIGCAFTF